MIVKICGITNREDALVAVEGGASALGFNFYPNSPRYIRPGHAARIIEGLPEQVWKVGVFVNERPEAISNIARQVGLDVVQLHGEELPGDYPDAIRVWKAFRFQPAWSQLDTCPAEAILLDGPRSGECFDWRLGRRDGRKIVIAGGLDAGNVQVAIEQARPWGVDACSRIESAPGRKDHAKMLEFLRAALMVTP